MSEQASSIDKLEELLRSEQEEERLAALQLVDRKDPEPFKKQLFIAFGDISWRVRKEATELFLTFPQVESHIGDVVKCLYSEENAGLRNTAVEILIRLGALSTPHLIKEIASDDHDVRKFALDILGEIPDERSVAPMIEALKDDDGNVRAAAAENLGKLGAAEAVAPLLEAMETPDLLFRFTILEALGQINVEVPVERLLAYSDDKLLRKALLDCLGRVGDSSAIPFLLQSLSDEMKNVREAAVLALGKLSHEAQGFLENIIPLQSDAALFEAVIGLLTSSSQAVKKAVVNLLPCVATAKSVTVLLDLVEDPELREDAVMALISIGKMDAAPLLAAWSDTSGRCRAYLTYIYGEAAVVEAIDHLLSALADTEPEMRQVAVQSLGKVGGIEVIPQLVAALGDDTEEVCEAAMQSLIEVGDRHYGPVVEALCPYLEDPSPQIRMYVITVLGRLDGEEVEEHIAASIKDASAEVRSAAIRALEGKSGATHISALMLALTDENSEVRALAAEALGSTGSDEAIDSLRLALQDEDMWVRAAAIRSLGQLCGAEAAKEIEPSLLDPVGLVSITVLETLKQLGLEGFQKYALAALEHKDAEVINAALKLLQESGDAGWFDGVEEFLSRHPQQEVRLNFARVMAEVKGAACREKVEAMLAEEEDEFVRHELQELLVMLKQEVR
ncbi:MAG: hypothetical protein C0615_12680 [Desulfuromonas sp.]|mgnify:CR=1 FL=1|nr:MAG: hypothetical protein C0615_12680 [Desulfuromonas sp.]